MNKMNIPAPFRPALPTPPLPPPAPLPAPPKRQEGDLSSGESELESSNEVFSPGPNHYPMYRPLCHLGIDACIYRDMLK